MINLSELSCLEPMVKELPDKYREAVQLSELENKTQKEIAELENISTFATNFNIICVN